MHFLTTKIMQSNFLQFTERNNVLNAMYHMESAVLCLFRFWYLRRCSKSFAIILMTIIIITMFIIVIIIAHCGLKSLTRALRCLTYTQYLMFYCIHLLFHFISVVLEDAFLLS